jgi:hypothetical protein
MPMPETAIDKDDGVALWKDEVWPSVDFARVKTVPEAACVQRSQKRQFRPRVLSLDPCHHAGAGLLIHNICHVRPGFRS